MDLTAYLPYAIFGGISVVVLIVFQSFSKKQSRAEERLDEMNYDEEAENNGFSQMSALATWLQNTAPKVTGPLMPKKENDKKLLKERLDHAGFRSEASPAVFLLLQAASVCVGFMLGGGYSLIKFGVTQKALMWTLGMTGGFYFLPNVILWFITKGRKENIFLSLPDAIDLMVVSVEAGLGLDQAMRKVSEEMEKSYPVISKEFGISNMQLQMGHSRNEVLRELGRRNGEDDLQSLASVIIQAGKFGSGVGQALRVQSDSMRTKRRQIAEEKAAKTAVKLIFPLVLFIFPSIFVVLVGPAAISMIRNLLPAMNGG